MSKPAEEDNSIVCDEDGHPNQKSLFPLLETVKPLFSRKAAACFCIGCGLSLVTSVPKLLSSKKKTQFSQQTLRDCFRLGACVYNASVVRTLSLHFLSSRYETKLGSEVPKTEHQGRWERALCLWLSGCAAGVSAWLLLPADQVHTLLLYVAVRSAYTWLRVLSAVGGLKQQDVNSSVANEAGVQQRFRRLSQANPVLDFLANRVPWDFASMWFSLALILHAYQYSRASTNPSYRNFLVRAGGIKESVLDVAAARFQGKEIPEDMLRDIALQASNPSMGPLLPMTPPKLDSLCQLTHTNMSCSSFVLSYVLKRLSMAVPLYLSVHSVSALVIGLRGKASMLSLLQRLVSNIWWSSCFLTGICSAGCASLCLTEKWLNSNLYALLMSKQRGVGSPSIVIAQVFVFSLLAASSIFFEFKHRRMELALYVLPRALEIAVSHCQSVGLLSFSATVAKALKFALLVCSFGALSTALEKQPHCLRSLDKLTLTFLWG